MSVNKTVMFCEARQTEKVQWKAQKDNGSKKIKCRKRKNIKGQWKQKDKYGKELKKVKNIINFVENSWKLKIKCKRGLRIRVKR